jgi:hypothetical protein
MRPILARDNLVCGVASKQDRSVIPRCHAGSSGRIAGNRKAEVSVPTIYRYELFKGIAFLGSRGHANTLRLNAEEALSTHAEAIVEFDFSNVRGVSHGFLDELLTPLDELLAEQLPARVKFTNCSDRVADTLDLVCSMHHLHRPELVTANDAVLGNLAR